MKIGLTQKFLAPALVAGTIFTTVFIYRINSVLRKEAIERTKDTIAEFVRLQVKQYVVSPADFSLADPEKTDQIFSKLLEGVKTLDMVRIKVWAKDGTIIFSDAKSIVGKNFVDDEHFQEAMRGEIAVDITALSRAENVTESGYGQLMEVSVPIEFRLGEGPVGVVEAYYIFDGLNASILKTQHEVILITASGFLFLALFFWLLLHLIVIKPLQVLEAEIIGQRERERERLRAD